MLQAIDLVVPHQANRRWSCTYAKNAGIPAPSVSTSTSRRSATSPPPPSRWRSTCRCRTASSTGPMRIFAPGFRRGAVGGYVVHEGRSRRGRALGCARVGPSVALRAGCSSPSTARTHSLCSATASVVVEGERIVHVGRTYETSRSTRRWTRADRVLTRGSSHPRPHRAARRSNRSFIEIAATRSLVLGPLRDAAVRSEGQDEAASRACVDFSMAELLRGGVTTVTEIGGLGPYVVERAAHYGLRTYMASRSAPAAGSPRRPAGRVEWDERRAPGPAAAGGALRQARRRPRGVVCAATSPRTRWTRCTGDLLREAKRRGDDPQRPVHAPHLAARRSSTRCCSATERRRSPGWRSSACRPQHGAGHALIIGGSSWTTTRPATWASWRARLHVAHAPWLFAAPRRRDGVVFALYAGTYNVALGTTPIRSP